MKILGIDPGLSSCGWAIIEVKSENSKYKEEVVMLNKNYNLVCYGSIETSSQEKISYRLKKIFNSLSEIISKTNPDTISLESQFYSKIAKSMISAYLATGIVYLIAGMKNLDVYEYSAKTVKSSITGYGSASKNQLKKMVQ
ncbi:MAG: crossover junction endodeoxyribonuclease RuvC, partial [Endomicrobiia bacterium]